MMSLQEYLSQEQGEDDLSPILEIPFEDSPPQHFEDCPLPEVCLILLSSLLCLSSLSQIQPPLIPLFSLDNDNSGTTPLNRNHTEETSLRAPWTTQETIQNTSATWF